MQLIDHRPSNYSGDRRITFINAHSLHRSIQRRFGRHLIAIPIQHNHETIGRGIMPTLDSSHIHSIDLALVDCQDPTANWLFSGAQLFSAACWIAGHSAAMTVNEDCTSLELSLAANGAPEPMTRAQSFMFLESSFIESIVDIPSVEEGSDAVGITLGSDIRLKHNINLIDKSPSGIPIYSFQYRDGIKLADNKPLDTKSTFVGVMAQDLLELAPHALTKSEKDGYYRVDYSQIDVDFGKL